MSSILNTIARIMQTLIMMVSSNVSAPLSQVRHIIIKHHFRLQGVDLRLDHQLSVRWWSWLLFWYKATVSRLPLHMQTSFLSPRCITHSMQVALLSLSL